MSNVISCESCEGVPALRMSNGLSSVFFSVLALAASALAKTDREKALAVWFASHDQGVFGAGLVGFDLCEMPWLPGSFSEDQAFLLQVLDSARQKRGWEALNYLPDQASLIPCLDQFQDMIQARALTHPNTESRIAWRFGGYPRTFRQCSRHPIYEHNHGCPICND